MRYGSLIITVNHETEQKLIVGGGGPNYAAVRVRYQM